MLALGIRSCLGSRSSVSVILPVGRCFLFFLESVSKWLSEVERLFILALADYFGVE